MISTPEQTRGVTVWDRFTAPTERYRRPFRRWRRGRPFFAGLSIALAGLDIWYWPHSSVGKMLSMGLPGISSIFISIFLLVFAVTVWFFPTYRVFSGIAAIMLALLSLVASNLGGFILGFLLGMLGGAFAVAWTPRTDYTAETRRQRRLLAPHTAATQQAATVPAPNVPAGDDGAATAILPAQAGPAEDGGNGQNGENAGTGDGEIAASAGNPGDARVVEQATRTEQPAPAAPDPEPGQE
jgi:hypothetical protein